MFFRQIIDAFLVRTEPDSSMVNPVHIHITSAPQTRNENVLKTNAVSSSIPAACATAGRARKTARDAMPVAARMAADADAKEYSLASSTVTLPWTRCARLDAVAGEMACSPIMSL